MRIGIVGAGSMGQAHAMGWQRSGAEIMGFVSSGHVSAQALAEQYGGRAYGRFEDLLAEVDVIDLCVPTDLHRDMTVQAARAGKHVVCEKPIALDLRSAQVMIAACNEAGVRLYVAMVLRFFPQYRTVLQAVRAGQVGDLGVMRFRRVSYPPRGGHGSWFADDARSGGLVTDLMIHDLDFARLLGGDVTRVFAKSARHVHPEGSRDYALVTLRFTSGAMALVEGGWVNPPGVFRTGFDIAGTDGVLEWSSDTTEPLRGYLLQEEQQGVAEVGLPLSSLSEDPYVTQIRHVHHALEHNEPFAVTPQEALEALRLTLAARESLRTGGSVNVQEVR